MHFAICSTTVNTKYRLSPIECALPRNITQMDSQYGFQLFINYRFLQNFEALRENLISVG